MPLQKKKKKKKKKTLIKTITDTDYTGDSDSGKYTNPSRILAA